MQESIAVHENAHGLRNTIPVSVKGQWVQARALRVNGQDFVTKGKLMKIVRLHDEDWVEDQVADPEACVQAFQRIPWASRPDIFYFSQRVPDLTPRYPYAMETRSIAVAEVPSYEEWLRSLPDSTRINIKRAKKRGVELKTRGFDRDVIQGICDVQNETPVRQGRPYPHYGKPFEVVQRDHGQLLDHSDFICAYHEDEFIGFIKLVYLGEVAAILQMMSKLAHYDKRTGNALLAKAAEVCAEKGIRYLTYDKFSYGNKGDSSLRDFKVRHGFREMLVPSYYVPLTPWGRLCVKGKLYRRLHDVLPHSIISAGVELRAKWYNRKLR